MNIDDAARVLNEHKYRGVSGWHAFDHGDGTVAVYGENHGLGADVAIAIAEKLERDAGRDMPATRRLIDDIRAKFASGIPAVAMPEVESARVWVKQADLARALAELEAKP